MDKKHFDIVKNQMEERIDILKELRKLYLKAEEVTYKLESPDWLASLLRALDECKINSDIIQMAKKYPDLKSVDEGLRLYNDLHFKWYQLY